MIQSIQKVNFNQKTVLVRCDFNVSINERGEVVDDLRIRIAIPTIDKIINDGGKVVLLSHASKEMGLGILRPILEKLLSRKVFFLKNFNVSKIKAADFGSIFLLENLRFYDGEEKNDKHFAKTLASLGDSYVNEAFSVSHRSHASVVSLAEMLPHYAGLNLLQEVKMISKIKKEPWRPLVAIIGGAKVSSKIKVVEYFINQADHLLLGGKVANEILVVKGISLNQPWPDEAIVKEIEKVELTSPKIHLPVDVLIAPLYGGDCFRVGAPGQVRMDENIFDIGPETIKLYSEIIKNAKMIIWSGPLGLFEKKEFEKGTREIAQAIALNHRALSIVGGGDTGVAITKFNLKESIDHFSTGGGALLEFITGRELPGLKAIGYEN